LLVAVGFGLLVMVKLVQPRIKIGVGPECESPLRQLKGRLGKPPIVFHNARAAKLNASSSFRAGVPDPA
jgi:hypothetical protein